MDRLRETGPLWVVLAVFVPVFASFAVIPLEDTPFEDYGTLVRVFGMGGMLICPVVGLASLASERLRAFGQRLCENVGLVVSSSLTVVLLFALATLLGQPTAAAIGLGLVLTNAGVTMGIVRILSSRIAPEGKIPLMRLTELLEHAVLHDGSYLFLTAEGKYTLPDEDTAKFLGKAGMVLQSVTAPELDEFSTVTSLQSVTKARLIRRRDSGDHFFILEGDDRQKYKAHIASMSMAVDFRPDLNVSEAEVWPPHELQSCKTLR